MIILTTVFSIAWLVVLILGYPANIVEDVRTAAIASGFALLLLNAE